MLRSFRFLCITALLSLFFSCKAQQAGNSVDAASFSQGITQTSSAQILDVRTPGEYAGSHIKGALLADWNNREEFNRRISFIDKNKPLYIYCLAGGRSAAAAKLMRSNGFKEVIELKGGINAWKAAQQPLEGQSAEPGLTLQQFQSSLPATGTVLVDFGAEWCPPCRTMEPILKSLSEKKAGAFTLIKVDGGRDQEVLQAYGVTALPVFIIFKNGQQVWRKEGVATEAEIAAQL